MYSFVIVIIITGNSMQLKGRTERLVSIPLRKAMNDTARLLTILFFAPELPIAERSL